MNTKYYDEVINKIVTMKQNGVGSRTIGKELGIGKSTVNQWYKQYLDFDSNDPHRPKEVKEDDSFDNNLNVLCEHPDFSVSNLAKRLRHAHRANNQLRKIQREITDTDFNFKEMLAGVEKAVSKVSLSRYSPKHFPAVASKQTGVVEVLFSDWQIGKVAQHYNTEIGLRALKKYGEEVYSFISNKMKNHHVSKIVFASLGDIVEDHMKHGIQSAVACDSGLSEQISNAIIYIWEYVLEPILQLGITVEFVGIAGNHGSSQHKGMDIYKAGLYSYDYAIYTALQQLAKVGKYSNVTFNIPHGAFGHTEIFGNTFVYEHGYFNSATEKSMSDQMKKRGQQIKKHVEYFRIGDMHHVCAYDCNKMVLNGAFFGVDNQATEYSGVLGFNAVPAQVVMWHQQPETIGHSSVKELHTIQLAIVE